MREGYTVGDHPFFATAYPVCAHMGRVAGVGQGLAAGFALSVALTLSRPINGVSPPTRPAPRSRVSKRDRLLHRRRGDGAHLSNPGTRLGRASSVTGGGPEGTRTCGAPVRARHDGTPDPRLGASGAGLGQQAGARARRADLRAGREVLRLADMAGSRSGRSEPSSSASPRNPRRNGPPSWSPSTLTPEPSGRCR